MKSIKSAKPAAASKPVAKPAQQPAKSATAAPAKPEPAKRGTGYYIRRAVIAAFPAEVTADEIDKQLTAAGYPNTKRSTIVTCKQDCTHALRIAQELGRWRSQEVTATATAVPDTQ
jgi:hypothetical protein